MTAPRVPRRRDWAWRLIDGVVLVLFLSVLAFCVANIIIYLTSKS